MRFLMNFMFLGFLALGANVALADTPPADTPPAEKPPTAQEIAALREERDKYKKEAEDLKNKKDDDDGDDGDDLRNKAKNQNQKAEEGAKETKKIETALQFNLGVDDFVKKNVDLLPKEVADIVKVAHKETYDSAVAKASAIKTSVIQSYFSVESNLEALTKSQKHSLDDYLKLTKTGKEEKAAEIYANIFEPALETIRKIKKAEELGRSKAGFASDDDSDSAYRDKLIKGSRKTYLNERDA